MWPSFTLAGWVFVPIIGLGLVALGYISLVRWIPNCKHDDGVRTDFYSVRASYYMIGAGLFILVLWTVSAIVIRSLALLKALRVT